MKFIHNLIILSVLGFGVQSGLMAQEVYPGLVLFSPQPGMWDNGANIYLMNTDQQIVHSWEADYGCSMNPYLYPDSTLLYPYKVPNPTMVSGGVGGGLLLMDWDGNTLWEFFVSNANQQQHHDIEPMPNGNLLVIAWERKTAAESYAMGREYLGNPLNEMWVDMILELQPVGSDDAIVVWEWHLWDHLIQDVDTNLPGYGVVADHPELMDINYGAAGGFGPGGANADWTHFNCVTYNEELDQILITSRYFNEIYIIDHSTTTEEAEGHSGGNSGMGGDFLYRWGNPQVYDMGSDQDQKLQGPHGGVWIEMGYPGEGNLLIFNNGYQWSNSAVFELIPPLNETGLYTLEPGTDFGPESPSWIFTYSFYSMVLSGVVRLPNGNTLITVADDRRFMEVSPANQVLSDYFYSGAGSTIPRTLKYDLDYLTVDNILLGDVNDDGTLDILDVVGIVLIALNQNPMVPAADLNEDGYANILDIIMLINILLEEPAE